MLYVTMLFTDRLHGLIYVGLFAGLVRKTLQEAFGSRSGLSIFLIGLNGIYLDEVQSLQVADQRTGLLVILDVDYVLAHGWKRGSSSYQSY